MVRRINIDGDDQADRAAHGGEHRAVYVYQLDSYRYWEQRAGPQRLHLRPVRGELHGRGAGRRRGVHRGPLPHRRRDVRGDPAAGDVLSPGHPDGRAADALAAGGPPPAGLLPARPGGGPGAGRRRDHAGAERARAAQRRRHRRRCSTCPTARAASSSARCGSRRSARDGRARFATLLEQRRDRAPRRRRRRPGRASSRSRSRTIRRESSTIASFTLTPANGAAPAPGAREPGAVPHRPPAARRPDQPAVIRSYSLSDGRRCAAGTASASSTNPTGSGARSCTSTSASATPSRRGAARRLHPARGRAPGRPAQRRRRRDPGAGDAPRARHARAPAATCGGCTEPATAGARLRRRGRRTAGGAAPRAPDRQLQPARPGETPGRRL